MFSFSLFQGEPKQVLSDKKGIVIDESLAKRLYGKADDAIGKMVS